MGLEVAGDGPSRAPATGAFTADSGDLTGDHRSCSFLPRRPGFGALRTADLRVWEDVSGNLRAPPDYKHGTVVPLDHDARLAACGPKGALADTFICQRQQHV